MASLDQLPADQRAVLQLLLKQGRSYDDLSSVLRVDASGVRERAHRALDALGPQAADLSDDRRAELADYLLGQQPASARQATRDFLAGSAAGRAWARVVAGELRPLAGDALPEVPAEGAEVEEAFDALDARRARRDEVQRSSRMGGILLLGGLGLALAAVLVLLIGGGGDDDDPPATTNTQQQPQARVIAQVNLDGTENAPDGTAGLAQIIEQGGQLAAGLRVDGLEPISEEAFYTVWLYNSPSEAQILGYPAAESFGQNGQLLASVVLPEDARQFEELVITRNSSEPERATNIVVRGELNLPGGGEQPQGQGGGGEQGGGSGG